VLNKPPCQERTMASNSIVPHILNIGGRHKQLPSCPCHFTQGTDRTGCWVSLRACPDALVQLLLLLITYVICNAVSCKESFVQIVFANNYVQLQEKPVLSAFPDICPTTCNSYDTHVLYRHSSLVVTHLKQIICVLRIEYDSHQSDCTVWGSVSIILTFGFLTTNTLHILT
jgi:hypothetical protein